MTLLCNHGLIMHKRQHDVVHVYTMCTQYLNWLIYHKREHVYKATSLSYFRVQIINGT